MNQKWKNFLLSQGAKFGDFNAIEFPSKQGSYDNFLCALPQYGILAVSGNDASQFLQGQVTCDVVKDITDNKSSFAAYCTAKGRTISTFLIIKTASGYFLILPMGLLEIVKKRLQMFILRAEVSIDNVSDKLCVLGLGGSEMIANFPKSAFETLESDGLIVKYPSDINSYLIVKNIEQGVQFWSRFIDIKKFVAITSEYWNELEITNGIPWLAEETSEEYIPQMLNLDQLQAISFKKGCYTGQEIIARTHFLGKAKRKMYLAQCQTNDEVSPNDLIFDTTADNRQSIGKVLNVICKQGQCKMLIVIQTEHAESRFLALQNQAELTLSNLTYSYLN